MKKRILHIIDSPDHAGAARQMSLLVEGLPRESFEPHVCVLTRSGPSLAGMAQAGVPVTAMGKRWPLDPQAWRRLRQHMVRLRPEIVQSWGGAADGYGFTASRACGVCRFIAAWRWVRPWQSAAGLALDRAMARCSDAVVVNSPAARDFCVAHGLPEQRFRVISDGVAPSPTAALTRRQLLDQLGLPESSRLIGLVGRLHRDNRVKDAIWAADLLKVIRDDVHLLIFGDGPHGDRLARFRDHAMIGDKVHFLGDCNDVFQWMPHLDLLWSARRWGGQSSAILEAMAAGVPVVATDIPGTRELVVPEVTGYLVAVGHRAGLARWAQQILDSPELARRLGDAARQRALEEFGVQKMIDRYSALYRQIGL